jgi:phospholipid/cholesterol/gamma-HCH transport system ATP-binding protein
MTAEVVIRIRGLVNQFGKQVIHDGLDLDVMRGEVLGLVGGSGTGKSVLMNTVLGLNRPRAGTIELLGVDVARLDAAARAATQTRCGVTENVQAPMREHLRLDQALMDELAALKIAMVGLPPDAGPKKPGELSGGMRKRAGLARALALDPEVVFLDEPTAGLDPIGAAAFDSLIRDLQQSLGLTVVMVTHDLDSLIAICDRIAVLVDKKVRVGTMAEHMGDSHPWIQEYFHGPRARASFEAADGG